MKSSLTSNGRPDCGSYLTISHPLFRQLTHFTVTNTYAIINTDTCHFSIEEILVAVTFLAVKTQIINCVSKWVG